jgi:hypothetical protein
LVTGIRVAGAEIPAKIILVLVYGAIIRDRGTGSTKVWAGRCTSFSGELVARRHLLGLSAGMKMSSVERAARAFALTASGTDEWETLDPLTQERLKSAVLAALATIRDPLPSVVRAGVRKSRLGFASTARRTLTTWQAMIDATSADH